MRTISDDERRARLAVRHALAPTARVATASATADVMVALHATEPANVYLAAFARSGAPRAQIDEALYTDRSLVRQLAMRRTIFAVPRELFPAVRDSAAMRVHAQLTARLAKEVADAGLADDGTRWVQQTSAAVLERLRAAPATTAQLRAALPELELRLQVNPGKPYGGEFPIAPRLLSALAASGEILRGENDGGWKVSRPYWTPAAAWLGADPPPVTEREGYAQLVGRWLWTFGPGTEADLVWWLGATKGAVRRALEDVGAQAVALEDGRPAWLHAEDSDPVPAPAPWAALLPALDPTTMGWKERDFYLGPHAERIFDRNGNGGPTAWWDGRIVGGWTQTPDGRVVLVPCEPLPAAATTALEEQAAALTDWLDGDVVRSVYQSPLVRALG